MNRKVITIRVSPSEYLILSKIAQEKGKKIQELIKEKLQKILEDPPKKKTVSFSFDPELYKKLENISKRRKMIITDFLKKEVIDRIILEHELTKS